MDFYFVYLEKLLKTEAFVLGGESPGFKLELLPVRMKVHLKNPRCNTVQEKAFAGSLGLLSALRPGPLPSSVQWVILRSCPE